jgi:DNA-binding CsgD family transcriptional regulator
VGGPLMGASPLVAAYAAPLHEAVRNSSLAIALIELPTRRIVELSRRAASLLGSQPRVLRGEDVVSISVEPEATSRALEIVTEGVVDSYQASRLVRGSDGADLSVSGWVRVLERIGGRADAFFIITSARTEEDVSLGGESSVGHSLESLIVPLLDILHPHDLAEMLTAIDQAEADRAQVAVTVRLRDGLRGWSRFRIILGPIDDEPDRFGFVLTPAGETAAPIPSAGRVIELEHHLRRIAREVAAAGVVPDFGGLPDLETIPGLEDLSPRQREVVNRLFRGERVAQIARGMYLSPSTVRNHLANLFRKVGVHSQTEFLELLRQRD